MLEKKKLRKSLGIAIICLLAAGLSSCGTSRKMGCPMQFSQSVMHKPSQEIIIAARPDASFKPALLHTAS